MIYDIAGLRIAIQNKYEYTDRLCRGYLSNDQNAPADISVSIPQEEVLKEKQSVVGFSDGYVENICIYGNICKQIPLKNRFLLHASIVEYKGNGYAFLGKSGTGKSTHSALWLRHIEGTKIVNGDKPIVQYTDKGFIVYGTPWNGKEGRGYNTKVPLKGLCFLQQSQENAICPLPVKETVRRIFSQVLHPTEADAAEKTLELIDKLVTEVPAYLLRCTISEEAVQKSFEALTGEKYQENKVNGYEN